MSPRPRNARHLLVRPALRASAFPRHRPRSSRDLSLRTIQRRRRGPVSPAWLVLLLLTTGCACQTTVAEKYIVLSLPAGIAYLMAGSLLAGFLSGAALGVYQTTAFLRAADHATDEHYRYELTKLLRASGHIHDLAHEVIAASHARLMEFRKQLLQLHRRQV